MQIQSLVKSVKNLIAKTILYVVDISIISDFFVLLWTVLAGPFQYEHIRFFGTRLSTGNLWRPLVILLILLCIRWLLCKKITDSIKLGPFDRSGCYLSLSLIIYLGIILPVILHKYYSFEWKFPHDLAVLNQVFYNTLHGAPFYDTIFLYHKLKIFNYLGDHFEPIICLLLPFYYFNQDTSSLIIMQSLAITLSAIPIYFIAKERLKNVWIALFISILYLTHPLVISLHFLAFRPIIISIPFLLFSFYFIQIGKMWTSVLFLMFAVLCQESVFIASFGIGVYLLFRKGIKGHLKFGFAVIFLSMFSLYYIVFRLIPDFSGCGFIPFNQFGKGEWRSLTAAFANILRRLMTYRDPETNRYLVGVVKDLSFIPLLSPIILISSPFFLQVYMSGIGEQFWHASLIIPFLFISLIYGIYNLLRISKKVAIPVMFVLAVFGIRYGVKNFQDKIIEPFSQNRLYISIEPENYRFFKQAKSLVPVNSSLLTNVMLLPNLSARKEIHPLFSLGRKESIDIDWILCYKDFGSEIAHQPFLKEKFDSLISKNKYLTIYEEGSFYVMAKVKQEVIGKKWNFKELDDLNIWSFDTSNVIFGHKTNKDGLMIKAYFNGFSNEDEFARLRQTERAIDLKKYPYLSLCYKVEDPNIQTIQIVVGIDLNKDGKDDHIVNNIITHKASDIFTINLLDIIKEQVPDSIGYDVVFIELYLHKIWWIDCSRFPKKGEYKFWIKHLWFSNYIFSS